MRPVRQVRKVLRRLSALLPQRYLDAVDQQAEYARIAGYRDITSSILVGGTVVVVLATVFAPFPPVLRAVAGVTGIGIVAALPYLVFSILAERRRRTIEQVLPDALLLISANIESGLTIDKAFLVSARDEFGPLADDIRLTAMRMYGGMPVEDALEQLAESTNSELFEETLKLLVDGISSGGEVSSLLESSADDIRTSLQLREEIATNVRMYSMFIMIAAVVGAPLLFGVSTYLTETTAQLWATADVGSVPSQGFITLQEPNIDVGFFRVFAVVAITISNVFAALLISEIKNGTVKDGVKKIPVLVTVAILAYYGSLQLVAAILG
ncbi:MAG: type II secretion system F family protein [Candidatus Nanohaloarchaea archaeon]|nr:type II secretion system F family protein [Candidatus Nanohaloarchaea archaeon]